jgi:hypothetical protein
MDRHSPPKGTSATGGRAAHANIEVARIARSILSASGLKTNEIPFRQGDTLTQEGLVSETRCAYLVTEGALLEQRTRYIPQRGQTPVTLCRVTPGGIAFIQALSPAHADLPAMETVVAETDGKALLIDADWLQAFRAVDKDGLLLTAAVSLLSQLKLALLEEHVAQQADQDLHEMAAFMVREDPKAAVTGGSLKKFFLGLIQRHRQEKSQAPNAEVEALRAEVERLKRERDEALARERTAREGSASAFDFIEAERGRLALQLGHIWRELEHAFGKLPKISLSEEAMCAILGLDPTGEDPLAGDLEPEVDAAFTQATTPPPPPPPRVRQDTLLGHEAPPRSDVHPTPARKPPPALPLRSDITPEAPAAKPVARPSIPTSVGMPSPTHGEPLQLTPPRPRPPPLPEAARRGSPPRPTVERRTMTPVGIPVPGPEIPKAPRPPVVSPPPKALGIVAPPIAREDPPSPNEGDRGTAEFGAYPLKRT